MTDHFASDPSPFGLKAAPQLFSSIIQDCFQWLSLYGCAWFMDDVIQGSGEEDDTEEQAIDLHCVDLRRFFGRSRVKGFRYSIEKTAIAKKFIQYIGHMIGQGLLFTTEKTRKNMEKVLSTARIDMPDKSWERFFGFFQYSSKFLANFSKFRKEISEIRANIAKLRGDKTDSGVTKYQEFVTEKQRRLQVIVTEWKEEILHRTLRIPAKDTELTLITDASISALGFILYDSSGRIVELGGRMVNDTESRYAIYELELLAIAEAIEHYKLYIARASKLHILSDSKIARDVIISAKSCPSTRCLRFATKIQQCPVEFDIKYISTSDNPADFWSRDIPFDYENLEKVPVRVTIPPIAASEAKTTLTQGNLDDKKSNPKSTKIETTNFCTLSSEGCWVLEKACENVIHLEKDDNAWAHSVGAVLTRSMAKKMAKSEKITPSPEQVIPTNLDSKAESTDKILQWHERHYHLGAARLWSLMRLVCDKPPSRKEIEKAIQKCARCLEQRRLIPKTTTWSISVPDQPGISISIDHFTPFGHRADHRGYSTCLSIKDRFSKVIMSIPCYSHAHAEVVYHLQLYLQINGVPREIKMDNYFRSSRKMTNFLESHDIRPVYAPAYHPASNGDVEIVHKQLRKILPLIIENSRIPVSEWADACHIAANFINSTPHTVHGKVPIMVHRGYTSHEIFDHRRNIPKKTSVMWSEVKQRLEAQSERNIHLTKNWTRLDPGTKVYLLLGDNNSCKVQKVPATVVVDYGLTILAEKHEQTSSGRYDIIPVHKSQVTLRV